MPNQPKTPARSVRVPDELWEAAKRAAKAKDETVTDAILRGLTRYTRETRTAPTAARRSSSPAGAPGRA